MASLSIRGVGSLSRVALGSLTRFALGSLTRVALGLLTRFALGLLAISLFAATAFAQERPSERIEEGRTAYASLDYEVALEVLESALRSPSISPLERARALETLAFTLTVLGNERAAEERLRELFTLDPYYDVREPTGSPRIQALVDSVRHRMASDAALIAGLEVRLELPRAARADRSFTARAYPSGAGSDRVSQVVFVHRGETDTDWIRTTASTTPSGFVAEIPPLGRSERLEIYAEARDARGRLLARSAGPLAPTFLEVADAAPSGSGEENVLESWWLWTIVGVVVVGAGVGIGVGVATSSSQAPSGTLSPGRVILP